MRQINKRLVQIQADLLEHYGIDSILVGDKLRTALGVEVTDSYDTTVIQIRRGNKRARLVDCESFVLINLMERREVLSMIFQQASLGAASANLEACPEVA